MDWGERERERPYEEQPHRRCPPRKRLHNEKNPGVYAFLHSPIQVFIVAKCRRLAPVPTDRGPHKSASFAIHLWDHYKTCTTRRFSHDHHASTMTIWNVSQSLSCFPWPKVFSLWGGGALTFRQKNDSQYRFPIPIPTPASVHPFGGDGPSAD